MRERLRFILLALGVGLCLLGCASEGANLPMLQSEQLGDTYKLGPSDKLDVKVLGAEDLSGQYSVSENGTISMPMIGEVKAVGLTRAQVEQELVSKLGDGYVRDPKISVTVVEYRPFYIYGEVTKPGKYNYAPGMTVLSAVSVANGYTPRANTSFVVITRKGQDRKAVGMTPILPDDIIMVPERYF